MDGPAFESVEVAVVPGGGLQTRPFEAAGLYHAGKAQRILSFVTEVLPSEEMGLTRPSDVVTLEILEGLEVPPDRVITIGDHVTSTHDEVVAVREWALENSIESLVVLTEIFPSRRVAWSYRRAFEDTAVSVHLRAITPRSYSSENWWRNESGLIAFQNEVIKYFYYRLRY